MELQGRRVLVVGTGISGIGAAEALSRIGACPVLYDENSKASKEEVEKKLSDACRCEVIIGALPEEVKDSITLVVLSPGVPVDTPLVDGFRGHGVTIWEKLSWRMNLARER